MSRFIYGKLALTNLKKNRKAYLPYLLTCIITVAMFYIMFALTENPNLEKTVGGEFVIVMLRYGLIVVGIFAVIFLFYTNSFLIKQRKKEIGLYNVLGLGKRHIARMMICEMLAIAGLSLFIGLGFGILLSKLMFLILLKVLHLKSVLDFTIESTALIGTLILFLCIFAASLIYNLLQVQLANPIELLRGGKQGEKEPKTKLFLTIIGVLTLGGGYYIAQTTASPLEALWKFLLAVILVIIGTYALFIAGSIAFLKLLKKNKKYYYHTKHFISVSGMMYRMKQNAVGLANICILSTMVLVMISTTAALYVGMEDLIRTRYQHEVSLTGTSLTAEEKETLNAALMEIVEKHHLTIEEEQQYECTSFAVKRDGNQFQVTGDLPYASTAIKDFGTLYLMTNEEYNHLEQKNVQLSEDEILLYSPKEKLSLDELVLNDKTYKVKENLKDMNVDKESELMIDLYYMVLPDESFIEELQTVTGRTDNRKYNWNLDFQESAKEQRPALKEINQLQNTEELSKIVFYTECRDLERDGFYSLYGTFMFLGLFLGLLFLMAMVLIIYYKQISEGYDDQERFAIMQKVGISKREVKQTIRSQVMTVFFLPLVMAVLHVIFGFKVITQLLGIMNLSNITLFTVSTIVTVLVFAVFYVIVFAITAKEYYKIVKE